MEETFDSGRIVAQHACRLTLEETSESLYNALLPVTVSLVQHVL